MKNLLLLFITCLTYSAYASSGCLRDPLLKVVADSGGGVQQYKQGKHLILIPHDTCGKGGCKVFAFTPDTSGCHHTSLDIKGFYRPLAEPTNSISVKVEGRDKTFTFNTQKKKFL